MSYDMRKLKRLYDAHFLDNVSLQERHTKLLQARYDLADLKRRLDPHERMKLRLGQISDKEVARLKKEIEGAENDIAGRVAENQAIQNRQESGVRLLRPLMEFVKSRGWSLPDGVKEV